MDKIKKILAPADLSNLSKASVSYALEIASSSEGAEVIVYNVLTPEETPFAQAAGEWLSSHADLPQVVKAIADRKKLLVNFIEKHFADFISKIRMRPEVEVGVPYKKIVERATAEHADLIVMCTHGRTGLQHILIGSVTEQVVRRAPCPVLTVPPPK